MRDIKFTVDEKERNMDWEEVETKIAIILYKFSNIPPSYKDDLAQELRIHSYYFSDNYYDLYRCAIDFWRKLTRKEFPEVPFIDLDLMRSNSLEYENNDGSLDHLITWVKKKLYSDEEKTNKQKELDMIAVKVFDIIVCDVKETSEPVVSDLHITVSKYYGAKISVTYLEQLFENVTYKKLNKSVKRLEGVVSQYLKMESN